MQLQNNKNEKMETSIWEKNLKFPSIQNLKRNVSALTTFNTLFVEHAVQKSHKR